MAHEGKRSIDINATPERILEVITEIEDYPTWMDAFHKAEVVERDDQGRPSRASFEVDARIKVLKYALEYGYPENGISWKTVGGDVEQLDGSYIMESKGDSTTVTYTYAIEPGFPVPGFMVKQGVKMMVTSALEDLKKQAEA
jgi:ribosome-associated toxin RatA of RatAB toxin-antitoxin module